MTRYSIERIANGWLVKTEFWLPGEEALPATYCATLQEALDCIANFDFGGKTGVAAKDPR